MIMETMQRFMIRKVHLASSIKNIGNVLNEALQRQGKTNVIVKEMAQNTGKLISI